MTEDNKPESIPTEVSGPTRSAETARALSPSHGTLAASAGPESRMGCNNCPENAETGVKVRQASHARHSLQAPSPPKVVPSLSDTMTKTHFFPGLVAAFLPYALITAALAQSQAPSPQILVLHAARLLEIDTGRMLTPGEVLVQGERIAEVGPRVTHSAAAEMIDLGDSTLLPGLIDAHIHLFLHPGAEDFQTIEEAVPQRTILAVLAARADLMAGFTAERDMGTEGAGSADTAVRNAINQGLIPGPHLLVSGNAVDILGGHEDALRYNPEQHVLSNATYANNAAELVTVIRQQVKEGADFIKIYETGPDSLRDGHLSTPYQYTEAELSAAVQEAARTSKGVAVHATGEPVARCMPHGLALSPSIMPINSATRPCG